MTVYQFYKEHNLTNEEWQEIILYLTFLRMKSTLKLLTPGR